MPLISSTINDAINSSLPFKKTEHYKGEVMIDAIARGTKDVFTSMAFITVNSGGGGIYPIEGVTPISLEAAINGYLTINIRGKHARGGLLSKASADGIAAAISLSVVTVPALTSGLFPVAGFTSAAIRSAMVASLKGAGIKTDSKHARIMDMVNAIAGGVALSVTSTAVYPANGTSGGVFVMV